MPLSIVGTALETGWARSARAKNMTTIACSRLSREAAEPASILVFVHVPRIAAGAATESDAEPLIVTIKKTFRS
jgi:hypothetical protein